MWAYLIKIVPLVSQGVAALSAMMAMFPRMLNFFRQPAEKRKKKAIDKSVEGDRNADNRMRDANKPK